MTKNEKIKKCKAILKRKEITYQEELFLREIIQNHPEANIKIGCGIDHFEIRKTPWGNHCFIIIRIDGSIIDFSYLSCLRGSGEKDRKYKDAKQAAREAVNPLIKKIKIFRDNEIHHHFISFDNIFKNWLKENSDADLKTNNVDNYETITRFVNPETTFSFVKYHIANYAVLLEVSPEDHKKIHKKRLLKANIQTLKEYKIDFIGHLQKSQKK